MIPAQHQHVASYILVTYEVRRRDSMTFAIGEQRMISQDKNEEKPNRGSSEHMNMF